MSNEEFEQRFSNALATIIENQARMNENQARFDRDMQQMQEAIAGLIQVARIHDEQIDDLTAEGKKTAGQIEALGVQVKETSESVKQTTDNLNALIQIVDHHVSNHP